MAEDSCHEGEEFKMTPGRVFIVPLGVEGKPHGEPLEWGPLDEVNFAVGSVDPARGFDWGQREGLDGGLDGGLHGARAYARGGEGWSVTLEISDEVSDDTMALLWGMTVEEYRDFRRWLEERAWLERMTDGAWGLE